MILGQKNLIRAKKLAERMAINTDLRSAGSLKIIEKIEQIPQFQNAQSILAYYPFKNEVDIGPLIKKYIRTKKILLPRIKDHSICVYEIKKLKDLHEGTYNIMEPHQNCLQHDTKNISIILVPALAFDLSGNRLGYGKGYYDFLLKNTTSIKIGLGYDFQILKKIPVQPHDQKMDMIVTEKQILNFNPKI